MSDKDDLRKRLLQAYSRRANNSRVIIQAPDLYEVIGELQDKEKATAYIVEMSGEAMGGGEYPVAFLIASHRALREKLGIQNNRLADLVSLLLQTRDPIGPMRDRKDYPPELQKAIDFLHGREST